MTPDQRLFKDLLLFLCVVITLVITALSLLITHEDEAHHNAPQRNIHTR